MAVNTKIFNAKILLIGEYTVMTGSDAMAVPYNGYSGRWFFDHNRKDSFPSLDIFCKIVEDKVELCEIIDLEGFKRDCAGGLYFESDIPTGYGLGSSGALVAAFYDRYCTQKSNDMSTLKSIFASIESGFHGSSSGTDPLVSYLNCAVQIKSDRTISTIDVDISNQGFFLIDTAIPRKTLPLVALFQQKLVQDDCFQQAVNTLTKYNSQIISDITNNNSFIDILTKISEIQYHFFQEMIPDTFIPVWQNGLNNGLYVLKLCGAGGGGMILGWTSNPEETKRQLRSLKVSFI